MAPTIQITCPQCKKQVKAPESVFGKKVRCKFCQAAFVAGKTSDKTAPGKPGKPPAAKATKPEPAKPSSRAVTDDDEEDENPYGMEDISLSSRCPDCANEMEEGAIICLICGYNTQTRERHKTVKTYDNTVVDQVGWLLPGIFCVLIIIATIIFDVWYLRSINDLVDTETWYGGLLAHHGIKTWVVICSLFIIFLAGRFAIKRLILHYAKPEVEKTK